MLVIAEKAVKPFLKWAGGKAQLLDEINRRLPDGLSSGEIETYIEPFVGGGAVFFYVAQKYSAVKKFYLFDINEDLVNCYNAVKNSIDYLINRLKTLEKEFRRRNTSARRNFYYRVRSEFNNDRSAAKLIFLNRTCYNGLYRVNRKGEFNVPFGDYKNPTICNAANLRSVSQLLQDSEILCADFEECNKFIDDGTFVYLDPPYRPLSSTAGFTSYSKDSFSEKDQIKLAEFCKQIHRKGAKFLLSNSDPKNEGTKDHFFEDYYKDFTIDRVKAARPINCKAAGRGQINELLITNYKLHQSII